MSGGKNCRYCHRNAFLRDVSKFFKIGILPELLLRLFCNIYKSYPFFIIEISIKWFIQGQVPGCPNPLT